MGITVAKFGGTSMGNAQAIQSVANIVANTEGQKVAVVSATSGTTDVLIELGSQAVENGSWAQPLKTLIERHEQIVSELGLSLDLNEYWEEMKNLLQGISLIKELSLSALDRLQSFGERVSSNILAALLEKNGVRSRSVDAYSIIYADNNFGEGNVDIERTNEAIQTTIQGLLDDGITPVITGFIGQAENRQYITLGRGGSDYTAAIVAAALSASELQIWTDVDGIFNADPRLIQDAQALDRLSFEEASELAFFGAKVLHPKTINPAVAANIPVKILNTFNVDAPGTLIVNDENESIKSVTYKKDITIINVCSTGMLAAHGFLARIFEVFARNNISVDVVSTSEVSVSLTVENGVADNVIEELSEFARVNVQKNMAIVCLVGNGIRSTAGVLGNLFSGLNEFNISMVSQGASQRNITFLVDENDAQNVVQNIFRRFFN